MHGKNLFILVFFLCIFILTACRDRVKDARYSVPMTDRISMVLQTWHINCIPLQYDKVYTPRDNQLDLMETFNLPPQDSMVKKKEMDVDMSCMIFSNEALSMYLEVKCEMPHIIILNGDTLQRIDIQGLNIFPFKLKKGENILLARTRTRGSDWSIETTIYDSLSMAQLYVEGQSCNIIYPIISAEDKEITLTNTHQNILHEPVYLTFSDTYGNQVSRVRLKKGICGYHVPDLEKDVSYMCTMGIGKTITRQPIVCGKEDDVIAKFKTMRNNLPYGHSRTDEIDQILYRLDFLLKHPSRYDGDWWWQFKISPLTYQLEHIFTHINETYGKSDTEFNVHFITYNSTIDNSLQHYLLVTPNDVNKEAMPLVVIVRPFCENLHHFFASPQLARQWAINIVQGLANHYKFIVMMPEGRMLLNEDVTPIVEKEIRLAIADVMKHYRIDVKNLFLQANCTGGYRALKLAEANPDLFSAIALYAPTYDVHYDSNWSKQNTARQSIIKLRGIPMMIHYDPIDKHTELSQFNDLITECAENGIPLTLSTKRNSGKYYNVVIAGNEAFNFFSNNKH